MEKRSTTVNGSYSSGAVLQTDHGPPHSHLCVARPGVPIAGVQNKGCLLLLQCDIADVARHVLLLVPPAAAQRIQREEACQGLSGSQGGQRAQAKGRRKAEDSEAIRRGKAHWLSAPLAAARNAHPTPHNPCEPNSTPHCTKTDRLNVLHPFCQVSASQAKPSQAKPPPPPLSLPTCTSPSLDPLPAPDWPSPAAAPRLVSCVPPTEHAPRRAGWRFRLR